MLDMVSRGFIRVIRGLLRVTMGDQGLMRRESVLVLAIVLRGLAMMIRRLLVVIGGGKMMIFAGNDVVQGMSPMVLRAGVSQPSWARGRG